MSLEWVRFNLVQAIRDFVVIKIDILYVYVMYMCVYVCMCVSKIDVLSIIHASSILLSNIEETS